MQILREIKNKIVLLLVFLLLPLSLGEAAKVENLRSGVTREYTRLVVSMDGAYSFKEEIVGNRLYITLPVKASRTERILVRDSLVRRAYLEPYEEGARLVVVMGKTIPAHKTFLLKNPHRLVVDFPKKAVAEKATAVPSRINIGKGLVYSKNHVNMGAGNVIAHVLELSPGSAYKLNLAPGYGKTIQKGVLSEIGKRSGAVAAVNASYFDSDIWVIGNLVINNKPLGIEKTPRTALVIDKEGKADILPFLSYSGRVVTSQGSMPITGLNRMRLTDDLIYYNDGYDTDTGTNQYGTEVRVRDGMVVEVITKGRMALNSASYVLSGNGTAAAYLNKLLVGDKVELQHDFGHPLANAATSLAGAGPLLVNGGKVEVTAQKEQIASDISWGRSPRTGVGLRSDGTVLLVVVDGRSRYSVGMTLNEFAQYFVRLKANKAMNFDGGGSSEMLVKNSIMNNPSDGRERPIRVALGIFPA